MAKKADSFDTSVQKPWWKVEEPDDAANELYRLATSLESDQQWRRTRALLSVALYQSRGYQPVSLSADPLANALGSQGGHLLGNDGVKAGLLRSACDTLKAEIAGRVKPTVKFLTRGADWKTKRKAEGLADWVDSLFRTPQGDYQNLWCLGPEIFLDSLIFGEGWVQVGSQQVEDSNTYDITFSRQFPWEMFVDTNEARYGRPQNLFRVSAMSVDEALLRFVDEQDLSDEEAASMRQAIIGADDAYDFGNATRVTRMVKVVEGWHLKRGSRVGRHMICVSNKCLFDEEWDREGFPFARMCWERDRVGFYARSMIEQGESLHLEFNEELSRLTERLKLLSVGRIFVEDGSIEVESVLGNEEAQVITYAPGRTPPQVVKPEVIGSGDIQMLDRMLNLFYSTLGVSEMKASSRKEPGVESGLAIRLMNDQQAGRFATAAEGYERFYVDCALCAIAEARMLSEENGRVKVRSEKRGEVDFKSVQLPERQVDITSHPASALSTDPAQRLAAAQELFGVGLISGPTFMRLIQLPDLESEINQQTAQSRYSEWICGKLLDAEGEEEYEGPDDLVPAKLQVMLFVANAYLEAKLDGAPELNLTLMRRFVTDLDDMITRQEADKQRKLAAMNPPPGPETLMPGPGAAPPMAPPLPPDGGIPLQ